MTFAERAEFKMQIAALLAAGIHINGHIEFRLRDG